MAGEVGMDVNQRLDAIRESIDNLGRYLRDTKTTLEGRMRGLEDRFGGLEVRFSRVEVRFSGLEDRFGELEVRFSGLDDRVGALGGRTGSLEQALREAEERLSRKIDVRFDEMEDLVRLNAEAYGATLEAIDRKLADAMKVFTYVRDDHGLELHDHARRIDALERARPQAP